MLQAFSPPFPKNARRKDGGINNEDLYLAQSTRVNATGPYLNYLTYPAHLQNALKLKNRIREREMGRGGWYYSEKTYRPQVAAMDPFLKIIFICL